MFQGVYYTLIILQSGAGATEDVSFLLNSVVKELQAGHTEHSLQEALFSLLGFQDRIDFFIYILLGSLLFQMLVLIMYL